MSTRAAMKAEIADDLSRSDLTDAIERAISSAIRFYQATRFYFTESRDLTFQTVNGQLRYTRDDDADIASFVKLDAVFITVSGQNRCLEPWTATDIEAVADNSASRGQPYAYCYFDQGFSLYPIADQAYTVRPIGHVLVAEPASDAEADNPWMLDGYQLVRRRAAADVALSKIRDPELAQMFELGAETELTRLIRLGTKRKSSGIIQATTF